MALVFADRVKVRSYTTGTGEFLLGTVVPGFQSFSAVGDGNECYYGIEDHAGNWEVGRGTYSTDSTQAFLYRDTIISSSNSNNRVNFPAGGKSVFTTLPSSVAASIVASTTFSFSNIAVATQSTVIADSTSDTLTLVAGNEIDITTNSGTDTITINADLSAVGQNVLPSINSDGTTGYTLGSAAFKWKELFVANGSIYIGDIKLSNVAGKLDVTKVINPGEETEEPDPDDSDAGSDIGVNLGDLKIEGSTLGAQGENGVGWGYHNLYLDPGGESNAYISIPSVPNQSTGQELTIWNTGSTSSSIRLYARSTIQITANDGEGGGDKTFEFGSDGAFRLPAGGDILNSSGQSVLGGGGGVDGLTGNTDYTPENEGGIKYQLNINGDIQLKTYLTGIGENDLGPGFSLGDDNGSDRNNGVVAIGNNDVGYNAKQGGVYIGAEAGWNDSEGPQGEFAIAIGAFAARNFAEDNTITLNATGEHLDPTQTDSLFIKPVREDVTNTAKAMYYNTTTGEVTYADPTGGSQDNNVWIQTFVSDSPGNDYPYVVSSVEYDADGNIVALLTHSVDNNPNPNTEYFTVAKFDSAGTRLWSTRFASSQYTDGWGLTVDSVNNFVYVAGENDGSGAPQAYQTSTLTKINSVNGAVVWTKDYDFGNHSYSMVVDVGSDGHPVLVGYADAVSGSNGNRIITVKASSADGSILWSNSQDGQGTDEAYGMALDQTTNEVVVVGYTSQMGVENAATAVYCEPASNPNWVTGTGIYSGGLNVAVNFVAGAANFFNLEDPVGGRTVDQIITTIPGTSFGGTSPADDMVLKVGAVASDLDDRMLVTKFNSVGAIAWQKAVQFDSGFDCSGADADIDGDGNVYVCGSYQRTYNAGTTSAMHLMKFDSSGVKQWSRRVVGDCQDFATSIVYGSDNHLYLSGVTGTNSNSDYTFVIAKYTPSGTVVWQRLLDNTTTWTFGAGWFSSGGGSNLDVKDGYVVVSGSKGDPGQQIYGFIAQINSDGEFFSVGDWDFKGASFSGLLNATASDVTVVAAGKTIEDIGEGITVTTPVPQTDTSNFLIGTVLRPSVALGDLTVVGNMLIGTGTNDGFQGLNLAPGPGLAANMYFRIHGGDNPTHLHLSVGDTATYDQYFGTDSKYLKLGADNVISIGTNSNTWTFETNGNLALPGALVTSTTAKTGSSGLPGSGQVATVTLSSTNNTNFNPGIYPGIGIGVGSGYTLTLTVAGNGDLSVEITASGTGFFVGEPATLNGGAIPGGTTGPDDITLTVATLNNVVVATALDLTKSVNKLTNGYYTLADGVEGQIMYLVRQSGSAYDAITVNVANTRINGTTYTSVDYFPFNSGALPGLNMSTLIFTDGAWQADNGSWD